MHDATEKEWGLFREERSNGIAEINQLRQRVADEDARRKTEKVADRDDMDMDVPPIPSEEAVSDKNDAAAEPTREVEMDVDDGARNTREDQKGPVQEEKKEESASMQADDEDGVEY